MNGVERMSFNRRTLLQAGFASSTLMGFGSTQAFAQSGDDPLLLGVNPELRPFAEQLLPYMRSRPAWSRETLAQTRNEMRAQARPLLPDVPYERRQISGAAGQPDVLIYIVNAKSEGVRPAIVHTHGGGFVAGSAQASLADVQSTCKALDCVAVSVEYRLAPETTYRGSIEDNYAALKWLYNNAASLGADARRIAVMGESAGGGHAALLALTARDRGEVPVAFQCLIYPMLDDRTGSSHQIDSRFGRLIWTVAQNRFGWESFLGVAPGRRTAPRGAVPARVEHLAGLAPAFIGVGSIDLFCDEDIDYAQRLNNAGVATELIVVPGAFHGFDSLPFPSSLAQRFNAAKLDALRRGLGIGAAE